jgi:hypothetical protein
MTQLTDQDVSDIKSAIADLAKATEANTKAIADLAKATEANTKAIADLTLEMRVGFTEVKGQIDKLDSRVTAVENRLLGLDNRLWGFGAMIL